jgi:hypothetical protein
VLAITIMTFLDNISFDSQGQSYQRNLLRLFFILTMEAEAIYDALASNIQTTKTAHRQSLMSRWRAVFLEEYHLYITIQHNIYIRYFLDIFKIA